MPLINNDNQSEIEKRKKAIVERTKALFENMQRVYLTSYDEVWNSDTYTPQEILDAFGTDAADLFRLAGLLAQTIETAKPNTLPVEKLSPAKEYTINEDGSVTLTVEAPEAPGGDPEGDEGEGESESEGGNE